VSTKIRNRVQDQPLVSAHLKEREVSSAQGLSSKTYSPSYEATHRPAFEAALQETHGAAPSVISFGRISLCSNQSTSGKWSQHAHLRKMLSLLLYWRPEVFLEADCGEAMILLNY
jgi:hypothetical protein